MKFTPEQQAAIILDQNLAVTAGAGSGKTRVLVERYLRLLIAYEQDGSGAECILAITFTEKAAREMRERVRATIEQRAREAPASERIDWERRRSTVEAARIGTIHSFCAALLRAHPAETGSDPRFTVLDEFAALQLIEEAVDTALEQAIRVEGATIAPLLDEFGLQEARGMLTALLIGGSEVRAALDLLPPTASELAAYWQAQLTTARQAALRELLADPAWQAACTELLRLAAQAVASDKLGSQVLALAPWLAALPDPDTACPPLDFTPLQAIDLRGGSKKNWGGDEALRAARQALRTLRESYNAAPLLDLSCDPALEERAAAATCGLCVLYNAALAEYTRRKTAADLFDFNDLECRARELLANHPHVRRRWRYELRAVLVDEFQDTNDEQRAIIYALTGMEWPDDGAPKPQLFVVGDGKQSIYRFRGADVSVFQQVVRDIAANDGQAIGLDRSFRSHATLVGWNNRVMSAVFARPAGLRPYEIPFVQLEAERPPIEQPHCIELHLVAGASNAEARRQAEAQVLATRIKALVEGGAGPIVADGNGWRIPEPGDFALLFQAASAFEYYEQALRAAGLPFLTTAGRGYYGRKEVQDLIHLLRVLDDPSDELALVGVLRSPLFALDDATILRLRLANPHSLWAALQEAQTIQADVSAIEPSAAHAALLFARDVLAELYALRTRVTVVELLRAALARTGYMATISALSDGERRRVNVEKLVAAARLAGSGDLTAFSEYLELLLATEVREGEAPLEARGSVRLMTVHRSKGLEFPIVGLPDLGRNPPAYRTAWLAGRQHGLALCLRDETGAWQRPAAYQMALAEEARMEQAERERLLYVALTRAADFLLLSGPAPQPDARPGADWLSRLRSALAGEWGTDGPLPGEYGPLRVMLHDYDQLA